ncbi:MAG: ribonuclease R [Clostridia bacterium]|nr:ribonuclease R [Clostridia bacterium]
MKSGKRVKVNINKKDESTLLDIDKEYMKRKEILTSFFLNPKYVPMTRKEISGVLGVPKEEKGQLKKLLQELKSENVIFLNSNSKYELVSEKNSYICTYQARNDRYGFAICDDSKIENIYIPIENSNFALDGDKVLVVIVEAQSAYSFGKKIGKVLRIIERKIDKVIGEVYFVGSAAFVIPIDKKIPAISINRILCDEDITNRGQIAQVLITSYPSIKRGFEGDILKIVTNLDSENAYVIALKAAYELEEKAVFSKEVLNEITFVSSDVLESDLVGRVDRTNDNVFTIDSEDSKDLDDAICIVKNEDGTYRLSVHIADVSHYVKEGSKLDEEAIKRGTSIYIPGKVIPMLPKELSNGICSLNEGMIRLTLSVDMDISPEGEVINHKIYKGYIKSKKKMTYEKVFKCIEKSDKAVLKEYKEFLKDIDVMVELAKILRKRRFDMGSINFDIPETKVELDKDGNLVSVHEYTKNIANDIIEEFMLVTNEVVAEEFCNYSAPFIYRVHERPDEERLKDLNNILSMYNKRIKSLKKVSPRNISEILSNFETEEEKEVISNVTLRTLKLAKYDSSCLGHFGLAFKYYCHFTSPIRRYPDLFIHRVISDYLANNYYLSDKKYDNYKKQSISYSIISSEREKEATKIERDFDDLYKAMFMKGKEGQEFEGIISSVTSFGFFVKLKNTVEGLVHISDLRGYYVFDEKRYILTNGANSYKIGDKVKVVVEIVDIKSKRIDFSLI